MTRAPQPPKRNPLFRPIRGAGGLTPAALLLAAVLAPPAILGVCLLIWGLFGPGE